jgi:hypothetical protein
VRLDHLLSKEQLAPRGTVVPAGARALWWGAGYSFLLSAVSRLVRSLSGVRNGGDGAAGAGTLLGPEGTGRWVRVFGCRPWPSSRGCGAGAVVLSVS